MASELFVSKIKGLTELNNSGNSTVQNDGSVDLGSAFVGMYIGDGFLAFNSSLNNVGGYYITTGVNALNAGPVSLASTMTIDGTWVIV